MKIRIAEILKEKNMTALQLAKECGLSTVGLSKIMTGKTFPTSNTIDRIIKVLNVPMWQLFVAPSEIQGNIIVCPHCGNAIDIEVSVKK